MPEIRTTDLFFAASPKDQLAKVTEEFAELVTAVKSGNQDNIGEESFDLIEAVVRLMQVHGIPVGQANTLHLAKLQRRHGL